jgi:hypothetical protein
VVPLHLLSGSLTGLNFRVLRRTCSGRARAEAESDVCRWDGQPLAGRLAAEQRTTASNVRPASRCFTQRCGGHRHSPPGCPCRIGAHPKRSRRGSPVVNQWSISAIISPRHPRRGQPLAHPSQIRSPSRRRPVQQIQQINKLLTIGDVAMLAVDPVAAATATLARLRHHANHCEVVQRPGREDVLRTACGGTSMAVCIRLSVTYRFGRSSSSRTPAGAMAWGR